GLLRGSYVGLPGQVARAHLHTGVSSVARDDADVADAESDTDGDRFGRIEGRHVIPSWVEGGVTAPIRCRSGHPVGRVARAGAPDPIARARRLLHVRATR